MKFVPVIVTLVPPANVPLAGETPVTVGAASGVTLFDSEDGGPVKTARLVADTVKVYATPLVSPVTVIGLDAPVAVCPPGLDVTV